MTQSFLYSETFDFPIYNNFPQISIALLFMPRSGSTLLACLMQQSKALGFPLEYFSPINISIIAQRIIGYSIHNLGPLYQIRTSPNGAFSFKWDGNLARIPGYSDLFKELSPQRIIVMDREEKIAQARSYIIARSTSEWVLQKGTSVTTRPKVMVNEEQIQQTLGYLNVLSNELKKIYTSVSVPVLHLTYERVIGDPVGSIKNILNFCSLESQEEIDIEKVPISKQS